MNFENTGLNIAKIKHKVKHKNDDDVYIYLSDTNSNLKTFNEIKLSDENQVIQHLPYKSLNNGNTRQILYISGQSGSGKSYYASNYIKEYVKLFPKNKILLFSSLDKDAVLDEITNLIRVKLDENFYNRKLTITDFKDKLVIFDDTETISNSLIANKLTNIMNLLLTTGRHEGVYMVITTHTTNNNHKTRLILIEAHSITLFIKTMGKRSLNYVLESSFGLDKAQIDKISKLPSRWITIIKTYPMCILYENGIYILDN
jgi:chromosomal replication initiation ATPase DnaA